MDQARWENLLSALYRAPIEPVQTEVALAALAELTASDAVVYSSRQLGGEHGTRLVVHGLPGLDIGRYVRELSVENLWLQRCAHAFLPGAVVDTDDYLERSAFRATRLYRELLSGHGGIDAALFLCGLREGNDIILVGCLRHGHAAHFGAAERAVLARLAPHFVTACAVQRRIGWMTEQAAALDVVLDQVPAALFLFDREAHVVKLNEPAARLLHDGALLHGRGGLVQARRHPAGLARALASACRERVEGDARGQRRRVILRSERGQAVAVADVLALPVSLDRNDSAAAALVVQQLGPTAVRGAELTLQRLFGLTESEAALALALRQHGQLGLAAQALGITPGTARTRLKVVFHKVGEHSQAALLRVLDASLN